eukprot:jgi/Psemu1/291934/fgenesh1_pg.853_\
MNITLKSLLVVLVLGVCATTATASGLRGATETNTEIADGIDLDEDEQSRRKLPPGQPNYGLTPTEHYTLYGYIDQPGMYGQYGYYDGSDYGRGTYGHPWGDPNWYDRYYPSNGGQSHNSNNGQSHNSNNGYYANNNNGYYANNNNGYWYYYNGQYYYQRYGRGNGRRNNYRRNYNYNYY